MLNYAIASMTQSLEDDSATLLEPEELHVRLEPLSTVQDSEDREYYFSITI